MRRSLRLSRPVVTVVPLKRMLTCPWFQAEGIRNALQLRRQHRDMLGCEMPGEMPLDSAGIRGPGPPDRILSRVGEHGVHRPTIGAKALALQESGGLETVDQPRDTAACQQHAA